MSAIKKLDKIIDEFTDNLPKSEINYGMDRERIINKIQNINSMGRNNITELANLQNYELLDRLSELKK